MKETIMRQGTPAGSTQTARASRFLTLILACTILPAFAGGLPASVVTSKVSPRLASLQIEIWPEFDRPAALVILKGELAAGVDLPAAVSLRVSTASGGPTAVASMTGLNANLFNLKYDRTAAGDFITVKFDLPERFFHVEFYEPIVTSTPDRNYTYLWPGDMAAERVSTIVQEPAASSNVAVDPILDVVTTGQDGLRYRSAELGAFAAGTQRPIKISYTKTDSRLSSEILQLSSPASTPAPATGAGEGTSMWIPVLGGTSILLIAAGAAFVWRRRRRRRKAFVAPVSSAGFCAKCGVKTNPGDRFCSKCGALLG